MAKPKLPLITPEIEMQARYLASQTIDPRRPRAKAQPPPAKDPTPYLGRWRRASVVFKSKEIPPNAWWTLDWLRISDGQTGMPWRRGLDPWTTPLSAGLARSYRFRSFIPTAVAQEVLLNKELIQEHPAHALYALKLVLQVGLKVPDWLFCAFAQPINQLANLGTASIDSAFKHTPITDRSLYALRDRQDLAQAIWDDVFRRALKGAAIDFLMFEEVGKKYNIGKDSAERIYRQAIADGRPNVPDWLEKFRKNVKAKSTSQKRL